MLAMDAVRHIDGVILIECTDEYWAKQRLVNPFFKRQPTDRSESNACSVEHFEKGDVQARQCAAIQDGLEWLLHVDIDELWYSPLASGVAKSAEQTWPVKDHLQTDPRMRRMKEVRLVARMRQPQNCEDFAIRSRGWSRCRNQLPVLRASLELWARILLGREFL